MELSAHPLSSGGLDTPEQRRIEAAAAALFQHPVVLQARQQVTAHFEAHPHAADAQMRARLVPAADAIVFSACLVACNEDPADPVVSLFECPAHQWMGIDVPDARWGVDNPDNIYRFAPVAAGHTYELHGHFPAALPADFGLSVLDRFFGDGAHSRTVGFLGLDDIVRGADGRFTLTLDDQPAAGRVNHIQLTADARFVIVRDTLADWVAERPSLLQLRRLAGPATPVRSEADRAQRAAALGVATATTFLAVIQGGLYERGAANEVLPPISAGANGGLVTQSSLVGHYHLADDEALVITASRCGARYTGFQLADLWMRSYDYDRRLSSLNHHQAQVDADGLVRYVIAPRDPGVANWLDSGGHRRGSFTLRWQGLPPGTAIGAHMASGAVVKLDALAACLPPGSARLTPADRAAQQGGRAQARSWRFMPSR